MAQQLKAFLFQRIWVQFPAPTYQLTTVYNTNYRGSDTLFWPPEVPGMHMVQRHTCVQKLITHKIKKNLKRENRLLGWTPWSA